MTTDELINDLTLELRQREWSNIALVERLQQFADAVTAGEREACAKLAESKCQAWKKEGDGESMIASQSLYGMADAGRKIAATIRARTSP